MPINVGKILEVIPGNYQDDIPFERVGTVTEFTANTLKLDADASPDKDFYVGCFVYIEGAGGYDPKIIAYDGVTKIATIKGHPGTPPPPASQWSAGQPKVGGTWKLVKRYPVQRFFQWYRNNLPIPGAIGTSYTPSVPGTYTYREAAHNVVLTDTTTFLGTPTYQMSDPIEVEGTRDTALVYSDNLVYLGCFGVPDYDGGGNDNFSYGGPIAFNPGGNNGQGSLFIRGHVYKNMVGEITIPPQTSWATTSTAVMPKATLLGSKTYDPLEGQMWNSGITSGGNIYISGLHVYQNQLLVTAHGNYTSNSASWFWSRPLDLSVTGQVKGPYSVADTAKKQGNERRFAGYMADIPENLQIKLGGTVMCGLSAQSIVSATSDGPAIAGFNPSDFKSADALRGVVTTATQTLLALDSNASNVNDFYVNYRVLTYNAMNPGNSITCGQPGTITAYNGTTKVATIVGWTTSPTAGNSWLLIPPVKANAMSMYGSGELQQGINFGYQGVFNWTGRAIAGAAIPNGTRSVLVIGKCGNGRYQYTISNISNGGFRYFSGPGNPNATDTPGEKAWPYYPRIWCYDANDLEQATLGKVDVKDVKPYGVINFQFPFAGGDSINGVTYDKFNRRLYIACMGLPYGGTVIHVYRINNAIAETYLPTITTTNLSTATVGSPYSQQLSAISSSPVSWSISSGTISPLQLDAKSGIINGVATTAGKLSAVFRATNSYGFSEQSLSIPVEGAPPLINLNTLEESKAGTAYKQILSATGDSPISWSIVNGSIEPLKLDTTGVISGIPTNIGSLTATVRATNTYGFNEKQLTINVVGAPPQFITTSMFTATVGIYYSQSLAVSGIGPMTWSMTSGTINPLVLNTTTGIISGTPSVSTTLFAGIRVTNSYGSSDRTFTIQVKPPTAPVPITNPKINLW